MFTLFTLSQRNVVQHPDDIASTPYPLFLVNTVDIVNIAQWIGIYSTLCPHRTSFFLFIVFTHRWPRSVDQHRVEIMSTSLSFFLFYIFVIAILIGFEYTLCLHRTTCLHCQHRDFDLHWVDIVSTICVHRTPFLMFTSISSTS